MDRETFDSTIAELARRIPFEPFTITTDDGVSCLIDTPVALSFRGEGVAGFLDPKKKPHLFQHERVLIIAPK